MRVVDGYIDLPPPVSRAPGPFGFSDPDYITSLRGGAGFGRGDLVPWRGVLAVGGPGLCPSDAVRFTARIMDFDRLLDRVAATARARLRDELMQLFAAHHSPGEGVRMPAMTWLVAAQRKRVGWIRGSAVSRRSAGGCLRPGAAAARCRSPGA